MTIFYARPLITHTRVHNQQEMTSNNCSEGFGPDLLYRFPIGPYFSEPYGKDCYFSSLGYNIFAGIVLCLITISLFLHVVTLTERSTRMLTITIASQTLLLLSMVAALIVGWVAPRGFIVAMLLFMNVLFGVCTAWLHLGYTSLLGTIRKVEMHGTTMSDLLGGILPAYFLGVLAVTSGIIAGVGMTGVAVVFTHDAGQDEQQIGVMYYRLYCGGTAGSVLVFQIAAWTVLTRFIKLIDLAVINAAQLNVAGGGGSAGSTGNKKLDDMRDIAERFRKGRNMLVMTAPVGVGLWIAQTIVLPMFWYIVLLHFLNTTSGCFAVWFSLVSVERKRNIFKKATAGLMKGTVDPGTSGSNNKGKDNSLQAARQQQSPKATNQISVSSQ